MCHREFLLPAPFSSFRRIKSRTRRARGIGVGVSKSLQTARTACVCVCVLWEDERERLRDGKGVKERWSARQKENETERRAKRPRHSGSQMRRWMRKRQREDTFDSHCHHLFHPTLYSTSVIIPLFIPTSISTFLLLALYGFSITWQGLFILGFFFFGLLNRKALRTSAG